MYPDDRRYTPEHEWILFDGERAAVGITHFAQQQLGDVVYVELPDVGRQLVAHESFGVVESVKAVSELLCPAAGEVLEVNGALADRPELVNEDPHGEGWMIRLWPAHAAELSALLDASAYQALVDALAN